MPSKDFLFPIVVIKFFFIRDEVSKFFLVFRLVLTLDGFF